MHPPISLRTPLRLAWLPAGITAVALVVTACGGSAPTRTANLRWTAAACGRVLDLKNELHRDASSVDPAFGPGARIEDAITATRRLARELETLGLPPMERQAGGSQLRFPSVGSTADLALAAVETAACRTLAADSLAPAFS